MGRISAALHAFNRGEVARGSLARVDQERLRLSAETQLNFLPTVLGPMMLRPGLQHIGGIYNNAACTFIPFIFSNSDLALVELTDSIMRVWVVSGDTETVVTRNSVSSAVTSGDFSASTGWTLTTSGAGASATISGGKLNLSSPSRGGYARCTGSVTVSGGDLNVEHGLRITVDRGPVTLRLGSTSGGMQYLDAVLDTGVHSLAITPTSSPLYIQFETTTAQQKIVDACEVESSGAMAIPTTWDAGDLDNLRYTQSGDIIFVACYGQQPRRIERRSSRSWSFVLYKPDNGPFGTTNLSDTTLTASAFSGNITLTASRALFQPTHVGSLVHAFNAGQFTLDSFSSANTFGDVIQVSGVGASREFTYTLTGTWVATVTIQRSFTSSTSGFADLGTFVINTQATFNDDLDNQVVWYRFGIKAGQYTSGTVNAQFAYASGGRAGVARITGYTSETVVDVEVLSSFSSLSETSDWAFGDWSDNVGWPSANAFHDGRLWWAGRDKIWGSVSDDYTNFDPDYEGDAGPINRSVGFGPVDVINWLLPLTRLVVGREGSEVSIRASSLDEPITPTNFGLKDCSTQGSAAILPAKIDTNGVFVQRSNRRVYELAFDPNRADYSAFDLTRLNPDIGLTGFAGVAAQRQPDTIVHLVRADGIVASLVHDRDDEVVAWCRIQSDGAAGFIENVVVLPGSIEDRVYFCVKRTVNGSTVRYLERMARRDQCLGQPEARLADSHVIYSGSAVTTITGLSHLEGETVVVWGWNTSSPFTVALPDGTTATVGKYLGEFTVSSGQITGLASAVTDACVGLSYTGTFKSAKLAYAAQRGTALTQTKKLNRIGLILQDTHQTGIEFGQNFTRMDALPLVRDGVAVDTNTVWDEFDGPMVPLPGQWDTDSRLCLRATAPKPCTVAAAVIDVSTNE